LNRVGVVSYEQLKKWRRGLIFGLFCFAAVATPGGDPISMTALALALTLLFEVSIQLARIHDKRKEREQAEGWGSWSDDQASPLDHTPEPVEPPAPVDD